MLHPHMSAELTRAHRDDLRRDAEAQRLVRAARRRSPARAAPARPARWLAVLTSVLRRKPAPQPPC